MNDDDREAFDGATSELRELGTETLGVASTLLTTHAVHVAQSLNAETGKALLLAARLLYVLAHETPGESLG